MKRQAEEQIQIILYLVTFYPMKSPIFYLHKK